EQPQGRRHDCGRRTPNGADRRERPTVGLRAGANLGYFRQTAVRSSAGLSATHPTSLETKEISLAFAYAIAGADERARFASSAANARLRARPVRRFARSRAWSYAADSKWERFKLPGLPMVRPSKIDAKLAGSKEAPPKATRAMSYGSPGVDSFGTWIARGNSLITTSRPIALRFRFKTWAGPVQSRSVHV